MFSFNLFLKRKEKRVVRYEFHAAKTFNLALTAGDTSPHSQILSSELEAINSLCFATICFALHSLSQATERRPLSVASVKKWGKTRVLIQKHFFQFESNKRTAAPETMIRSLSLSGRKPTSFEARAPFPSQALAKRPGISNPQPGPTQPWCAGAKQLPRRS